MPFSASRDTRYRYVVCSHINMMRFGAVFGALKGVSRVCVNPMLWQENALHRLWSWGAASVRQYHPTAFGSLALIAAWSLVAIRRRLNAGISKI